MGSAQYHLFCRRARGGPALECAFNSAQDCETNELLHLDHFLIIHRYYFFQICHWSSFGRMFFLLPVCASLSCSVSFVPFRSAQSLPTYPETVLLFCHFDNLGFDFQCNSVFLRNSERVVALLELDLRGFAEVVAASGVGRRGANFSGYCLPAWFNRCCQNVSLLCHLPEAN
jgi:hypothetical protein